MVKKKATKKKVLKRARSAKTGQLVPAWYAAEHPDTTVVETVKPRKK